VDLESTQVRQQVNVGPGFDANPQDYVPFSAHRAFVPRFKLNQAAGAQALDAGGDILVLDPSDGSLVGSIDLTPAFEPAVLNPTPNRALMAGGLLRVTAIGLDETFAYAPGRLISIDPDTLEIVDVQVFPGIENCKDLTLSPDGQKLALACTGNYSPDALSTSAIIVLSSAKTPELLQQFPAAEIGGEQINTLEFTTNSTLAYTTYGRLSATFETIAVDTLRILDLGSGKADLEVSASSTGAAYALNEIRCIPETATCLLADGSPAAEAVRNFEVDAAGRLHERAPISIEKDGLLLPPRYIGVY
jgi:hypothetical protein